MRAIGFSAAGPGQEFTLLEVPRPVIDEGEALIRIATIGVGLHDRWFMPEQAEFPYAIGIEGAGVVEEVGGSATTHRLGDRVMFISSMQPKGGTWAEFAAVSASALVAIPDGLDFVKAAAIPVAGNAALEGLHALDPQPGEAIFMAGASGAIGTLAIQLARARGVRVAASASRKNHEYLLSLGVERAFDYGDPDWVEQVKSWMPSGVDGALAIQPETGMTSLRTVKDGGRVVTISNDEMSTERGVTVKQIDHRPETQIELADLAAEVAADRFHVEIEQVYPFDQGLEALEKTETRHARGKVVLTIE